jgi:hypothetical protein
MNSRDRARTAIEQQNGNAVGGSDPDAPGNAVRNESVAFALMAPQSVRIDNLIGVDLAERYPGLRISQSGAESMLLPEEFLECIASIDAVRPQTE